MKKRNYNDNTTLNTRNYSWDLVIYEIPKDFLQERLDYLVSIGCVNHYAYIVHDKDTTLNDNNEVITKPIHTHLLIVFNQNVSVRTIKNRLLEYTEHNIFGQPIKDKKGAYRYLTHKDDLDKYQYDASLIVEYDNYFSKYDLSSDLSLNKEYLEINQMIDDFVILTYRQLACKYGKDFIKNYKSYEYYFSLIYVQEYNLHFTHDDLTQALNNMTLKELIKSLKK